MTGVTTMVTVVLPATSEVSTTAVTASVPLTAENASTTWLVANSHPTTEAFFATSSPAITGGFWDHIIQFISNLF